MNFIINPHDISIVRKPTVLGLPTGMTVEYFGKVHGVNFVIFRPTVDWEYNQFRCLIGQNGRMSELPIKKVSRYRDGGTTDVELVNGNIFHFPTPFKPELKPTINGSEELIQVYNE